MKAVRVWSLVPDMALAKTPYVAVVRPVVAS